MIVRPRLSLRSRIAATISAAVLASTVALALIAYGVVHTNESGYTADITQRQVYFSRAASAYAGLLHARVERWIEARSTAPSAAETSAYTRRVSGAVRSGHALPVSWSVDVIDPSKTAICSAAENPLTAPCPSGLGASMARGELDYSGGPTYYVVVSRLTGTAIPLNLVVVAPSASGPPARGDFAWPTLGVIAGGTILALLIGLIVGQSVRRPLRRTALAARRFGAGDHAVRVPTRGSDELDDLGRSFNAMADQLETTLEELNRSQSVQRRFVADVSHELRSPLATMLAAVQGLRGDDATRDRSAALLDVQTGRLADLLEDLLEISRFDAGQVVLLLEDVDVVDIVTDAVNTVAPRSPVAVEGRGRTVASVDARRIHTVVRNLVANAVQHGNPPVRIDVDGTDTATDTAWITVQVADAGPGIDPARADVVFERFVRGDTARSARQANSGLGLAIAAENARLHGGTLTVLPAAPTRFVLRLPRTVRAELHRDHDETAT